MVQWLRICLAMQGTLLRSLIQGDLTRCGATKAGAPQLPSQCAATPDTRAPGACGGEPTALRSLRAAAKSSPHWQQLEKAQVQ